MRIFLDFILLECLTLTLDLDRLFNIGLEKDDAKNRTVIHTLRHTFASHLAINGTPIFTIKELMNHSDVHRLGIDSCR